MLCASAAVWDVAIQYPSCDSELKPIAHPRHNVCLDIATVLTSKNMLGPDLR